MSSSAPLQNTRRPAHARGLRPPKRISADYLRNAGLFYLERFPTSTAHFRTVMGRKIQKSCVAHADQSPEKCFALLESLIIDLQEKGYLNDDLLTRGLVTSYLRAGLSKRAILYKLQAKGLNAHAHELLLPESVDDLRSAIRLLARKKRGPFAAQTPDTPETQRTLALLGRKGFSYDICQRALSMPLKEAQELIDQI